MNSHVDNLSAEVNDEDLNALFSEHGRVSSVKIFRDIFSYALKGLRFVETRKMVLLK